jgi:hypothetical protein
VTIPPLNGTKTHPLTQHAYAALELLERGPIPTREINAGVVNRLQREDLVEIVQLPNPYPTSRKRSPTIDHMMITEAGRQARASRPK